MIFSNQSILIEVFLNQNNRKHFFYFHCESTLKLSKNQMACSAPQIDSQNANASAASGSSSTSSSTVVRPSRFAMEGVGARVVRGPDWKWGKQANSLND